MEPYRKNTYPYQAIQKFATDWVICCYHRLHNTAQLITLRAQIHRERRQLARLTDSELMDIGITRHCAENEAARSILDIPAARLSYIAKSTED